MPREAIAAFASCSSIFTREAERYRPAGHISSSTACRCDGPRPADVDLARSVVVAEDSTPLRDAEHMARASSSGWTPHSSSPSASRGPSTRRPGRRRPPPGRRSRPQAWAHARTGRARSTAHRRRRCPPRPWLGLVACGLRARCRPRSHGHPGDAPGVRAPLDPLEDPSHNSSHASSALTPGILKYGCVGTRSPINVPTATTPASITQYIISTSLCVSRTLPTTCSGRDRGLYRRGQPMPSSTEAARTHDQHPPDRPSEQLGGPPASGPCRGVPQRAACGPPAHLGSMTDTSPSPRPRLGVHGDHRPYPSAL